MSTPHRPVRRALRAVLAALIAILTVATVGASAADARSRSRQHSSARVPISRTNWASPTPRSSASVTPVATASGQPVSPTPVTATETTSAAPSQATQPAATGQASATQAATTEASATQAATTEASATQAPATSAPATSAPAPQPAATTAEPAATTQPAATATSAAPTAPQQLTADGSAVSSPERCRLNDGSACPASYFNGPLGKNNILPSGQGALLIEQYGVVGQTWEQTRDGFLAREATFGRKFDSWHIFANDDPARGNEQRERYILESGHKFVTIGWVPTYDLPGITSGKHDAQLRNAARYWGKLAPGRVMIRMFTEFNLNSTVLNSGYCGVPFQQAWQHVVTIFQQEGASNVGFWYVPAEGNNRGCITDSYPGDAYVDWVGSNSFNWCRIGDNNCYASPGQTGAVRFGQLFDYGNGATCFGVPCPRSFQEEFGPRKPFVVGETGTISDEANLSWKVPFLRSIVDDAPGQKYLKGVSLFDIDARPNEGPMTNFTLLYPNTDEVRQAAQRIASSPFYNVA